MRTQEGNKDHKEQHWELSNFSLKADMPVQKKTHLSAVTMNNKKYGQWICELLEMWKNNLFLNFQFAHHLLTTPYRNHYLVYS